MAPSGAGHHDDFMMISTVSVSAWKEDSVAYVLFLFCRTGLADHDTTGCSVAVRTRVPRHDQDPERLRPNRRQSETESRREPD